MNELRELYTKLYVMVTVEGDTSEATMSALYDVAIDCEVQIKLASCRHCKALCDPEHGACYCPYEDEPFQGEWPDDNQSLSRCSQCSALYDRDLHGGCPWCYEYEEDHDLLPGERWCDQCSTTFDSELHGPWCPHCHGLPIEDAPESPTQVVPNEEPQQFPMTEDDGIPF